MPDDSHVGIHEAVNAVLYTRLFVAIKLAGRDLAGDALAEAASKYVSLDLGERFEGNAYVSVRL